MPKWLTDAIRWTPFYYTSVVLVALISVTYFFFPTLSVILFFGLISLWSRIPCMSNLVTKDLEMIDFFSVIIAVNLSGIAAAFFSAALMAGSHLFSRIEYPRYAVMDTLALSAASLLTPLFHSYFGNLLFTMYAFSVVRYIIRAIFALTVWPAEIPGLLPVILLNIGLAYLTNTVYVLLLGNYMKALFERGLHLHWSIFFFAVLLLGFVGSRKWLQKKAKKWEKK